MIGTVIFDPLLPWVVLAGIAIVFSVLLGFASVRGLSGALIRGLSAAVLLFALANPSLREEERAPLSDIVLLVVDQSASQRISDRAEQTDAALEALRAEIDFEIDGVIADIIRDIFFAG